MTFVPKYSMDDLRAKSLECLMERGTFIESYGLREAITSQGLTIRNWPGGTLICGELVDPATGLEIAYDVEYDYAASTTNNPKVVEYVFDGAKNPVRSVPKSRFSEVASRMMSLFSQSDTEAAGS